VGGLPEAVARLDGLLLEDIGPEAIATGVIGALTGSIRVPDSNVCVAYARSHFSISAVTNRIADVYSEVLRKS
jgi:glycosyltransferase involved in cell wall biosynthesis